MAAALPIRVVNTAGYSVLIFQALLKSTGILDALGVAPVNTNVRDGTTATGLLLNGEADVCMQAGFGPVLAEIDRGAPLRVLAAGTLVPPQTIYSAKPEIRALKDLPGRTVGTGAMGAAMHQKTVALLRKRGIDESTVRFVNVGSTTDIFKAVVAGTVDAGTADLDVYADQERYGVHALADANMWTELTEYTNQAAYAPLAAIAGKRAAIVRTIAAYAKLYRFLQTPASRDIWMRTAAAVYHTAIPAEPDPQWTFYNEAKPFTPDIALTPERVAYIQELNVAMGLQQTVHPFADVADMSLAAEALRLVD